MVEIKAIGSTNHITIRQFIFDESGNGPGDY